MVKRLKNSRTRRSQLEAAPPAPLRPSPTLSIPPEICAIICSMVADERDLLVLCAISSAFRSEAEPFLYRSINLSQGLDGLVYLRRLNSWATATSKHTYLAKYVRCLIIRLPETVALEASTFTKLGRALAQCVNLKELRIFSPLGSNYGSFQGSLINKCSFRLTTFQNRYFDNKCIMEFWRKQTEIRVVVSDRNVCSIDAQSMILPKLVAVKAYNAEDLPDERSLERIEVAYFKDFSRLVRYGASLTTLNLFAGCSIEHTVRLVADTLPNLLHFGILESEEDLDRSINPERINHFRQCYIPKARLWQFKKLETLILQPKGYRDLAVSAHHHPHAAMATGVRETYHSLASLSGISDAGREIMAACTTLRRVAISAKVSEIHGGVWTRSHSEGAIRGEPKTWTEVQALSMFWEPVGR
ncbi:hypothetical protein R3P38DRAFT_691475 [Favolaschia claudopus]|uniref:F-box domain-containing protein n=1 Tax=Favolaschia claudopus TaxID=2862362 RepID=A0AAW0EEF0_9AGAR